MKEKNSSLLHSNILTRQKRDNETEHNRKRMKINEILKIKRFCTFHETVLSTCRECKAALRMFYYFWALRMAWSDCVT